MQVRMARLAGLEFERAGQAFQGGTGSGAGQGDGLDVRRKGGQCGYGAWTFGERVVSADTDEFMVWLPGLAAGVPRASCPIEVFGNVVGWRAAGGRR